MDKARLGLIGLVGEAARQDFWGTMRRVADIGYQGIEGGGGALLEGDVKANVRRFRDLGLEVICTSAKRESLRDELDQVIAGAHALEVRNVACWWGPAESREQLLRDAELYEQAGARLAAEGLRLCYHNHEHEFKNRFDGVYALDILVEHTDPEHFFFEVDIAWVTFGGEDPVKVIERLAGRVPTIHVKDLWGLDERGQFTAIGTGVVKVEESIRAALATGVEWVVVEQDRLRNLDAFETLTVSYLNLKERGLV